MTITEFKQMIKMFKKMVKLNNEIINNYQSEREKTKIKAIRDIEDEAIHAIIGFTNEIKIIIKNSKEV